MDARYVRGLIWLLLMVVACAVNGCGGGESSQPQKGGGAGSIVSATQIAAVTRGEAAGIFAAIAVPLVPLHDVKIYKIDYLTTDESGALITASGALVVPQNLAAPAPLLSSQHGTTTLKNDVPSTAPLLGKTYGNLEALAFGTTGYITVLPDYIGYGDSGSRFHPYLHAKTLASAVVDLLRAARSYCAANGIPWNGKLFLAGYSEGGYATMAATREIQEQHAAEFTITLSAPMAGPYDLTNTLLDILSNTTYPSPGYVAFAFWAYDRVYSLNIISQVFMPVYANRLDSLFDGTHELSTEINPALATDVATLFQSQFLADFRGNGSAALKAKITENDLDDWTPTVPIRLIHCKGDDIVSFRNSQTTFSNFSTNGAKRLVQLIAPTPDGGHAACFGSAMLTAKFLFDALKD
jgi:secretory lipase